MVKIAYHRSNGILATVSDDLIIRLFDVVAVRMVRKFEGHSDRITDICFSEDGKWLLSSSMDGTLRIWDVILARQIDAIQVDVPITALSMSPNMDVLATTHVDQNGIYLWVNQAMFSGSSSVDSFANGQEIASVKLPSISSLYGQHHEHSNGSLAKLSESVKSPVAIFDQNIPGLITLSLLPKSQWQSLINLDIIKLRNKPTEPPKKPEKAPFFLTSVPSLGGEIVFKPNEISRDGSSGQDDENKSNNKSFELPPSRFVQLLRSSAESKKFAAFTDFIKGLSPSSLDMELRMLQIIDDEDQQEPESRPEMSLIELLLDYFIQELSSKNNFEFTQAVVRLFLKIHGETIRRQPVLQVKARKLLDVQTAVWQRIDKLFQSSRCMLTFLSNSQVL
uniref:WDR36/Utp21 C-terminal domain-containing protein n=1 Tax=Kalanchoe fedtschenkoi TaxID=63787 RepID=A0A7N1A9E4_KALFE